MKKKVLKSVSVAVMGVMMMSTFAFAGTSFKNYDTTVARLNGSGYTGYQTKAISGANGEINSTKVGGSYVVDVRMVSASGNGAWVRDLTDNEVRNLPGSSKILQGDEVRIQFSNDWNTTVAVQVKGKWKSN